MLFIDTVEHVTRANMWMLSPTCHGHRRFVRTGIDSMEMQSGLEPAQISHAQTEVFRNVAEDCRKSSGSTETSDIFRLNKLVPQWHYT